MSEETESKSSDESVKSIAAETSKTEAPKMQGNEHSPYRIIVRIWPKTPVLYPVGIASLVFAILSFLFGAHQPTLELVDFEKNFQKKQAAAAAVVAGEDGADSEKKDESKLLSIPDEEFTKIQERLRKGFNFDCVLGFIFLVLFTYALFTICVDFEVRWAIIAVALVVITILALIIANMYNNFLPDFVAKIFSLTPTASPQFYLAIFLVWLSLMVVTLFVVRFHYVRIESNEVVVVGGFLEKQKRYSTFRMRYVKEIKDVMEYYLPFVRSGRLIFTFPGVEEPLVLDNVINIDRVIKNLDRLSSRLNVEEHGGGA